MRTLFFSLATASSVLVLACGGATDSDLFAGPVGPGADGGPGADASTDAPGSDVITPGGNCDPMKCGISAPAGFHLVTSTDRTAPCAAGWDQADVVSDPMVAPTGCSCACAISQMPDCSGGDLVRHYDFAGSPMCDQMGTTFTMAGAACTSLGFSLNLQASHYAVDAPPPTGGACAFTATPDPSKLTSAQGRLCAPPASCTADVCKQNLCIAHEGDVECPSSFPKKTLVGASADFTCGACASACTVTGTCEGKLKMFTDDACTQNEADFPADGSCNAPPSNNGFYTHIQYEGKVKSAACGDPGPAPSAMPKLNKPATVCCAK